ncbi:plastocyanin/azurin family copper-binding protein, partial [Flavobacteriales bacterium]|nr:plastocyanin/azurin family copper-binding protein [Flavobacteriales bacterium]
MKNIFLTLLTFFSICTIVKSENHTINAGAYYYSPEILTINVGDQVTWVNDGGLHDVNADENTQTGESFNNPESFQSNTTNVIGATIYTHTFTIPGTYNYDCSVYGHAAQGMVGQIIVQGPPSIMDIVAESEAHTTLEAAINAAELNETLDGEGTFTLFAPSDDAFAALPEGT